MMSSMSSSSFKLTYVCLKYLLVEQAVVCAVAAIYECELNSIVFDKNVKFQVS